jgi:LysM repeat protein
LCHYGLADDALKKENIIAMDNLSSADLDSSSKTPLFIGIAAVIIALTGVILGWLGFSKANELEGQLAAISGATDTISNLESTVESNAEMLRKAAGKITSIESSLGQVTDGVQKDIASVKTSMRTLAIQAGTALKKAEALEQAGVRTAPAAGTRPSAPASSQTKSDGDTPAIIGETTTHKIEAGDTYQKLGTRYKVGVNDIVDANPGVDPRRLRIGQEIIIPVPQND